MVIEPMALTSDTSSDTKPVSPSCSQPVTTGRVSSVPSYVFSALSDLSVTSRLLMVRLTLGAVASMTNFTLEKFSFVLTKSSAESLSS